MEKFQSSGSSSSSRATLDKGQKSIEQRCSRCRCVAISRLRLSSTIRGGRYEDTPFAIHIIDSQSQLVLLKLKLELADSGINDKGPGLRAETTNLSLADIEGTCR